MDAEKSVFDNLDNLVIYLRYRASVEVVPMKLDLEFFALCFMEGTRSFFGIEVDDQGEIIADKQQPELFKNWMARN